MRSSFVPTMGNGGARVFRASNMYAIREGVDGPIKIGRAWSPSIRVNELQTGNPRQLMLLGYVPETDELNECSEHQRLAKFRLMGEWFDIDVHYLPWLGHSVPSASIEDLSSTRRPCTDCAGRGYLDDALTIGEAARRLGGSVRLVRQLIADGELIAGRIGSTVMIEPSEIDNLIDRMTA